ncbi:MAG: translation initiation factor IF-2 [Bacteroidales bacterium]|nr:translation initiation factor IF-2 [Bacteroidales bacterium]
MEESNKTYRLSKIAIEFNIKVGTVVDFLAKKGFKVDNNPNGKITGEMYELLLKEFQTQKQVKETSKKLDIGISRHETVTLDKAKEREIENDFSQDKDLFIKNVPVTFPEETKTTIKSKETEKETAEKTEKKEPVQESKEPAAKEKGKIKREDIIEKTIEAAPTNELKIIGKIDIDKITEKKSTKKTKEETKNTKTKKSQTEETPESDKKVETEDVVGTPDKKTKAKKKEVPQEEPAGEFEKHEKEVEPEVIEPEVNIKAETPKDDNFIKTEYKVLTGPKVVDRIILPEIKIKETPPPRQFAGSSSDEKALGKKKKRKRIIKDSANVAKQQVTQFNEHEDIHRKSSHKKPRGKATERPEVSDEEIQKQIRETLARLSTTTKSKGAKYRRQKREMIHQQIEEKQMLQEEEKKILKVTEFVTVNEIAQMMNVPVNNIISTCMTLGLFVSINQRLDAEVLSIVAEEFGYKTEFISKELEETVHIDEDKPEDLTPRHSIVTVMGHVDHGKTLLLDYIRSSNVIAGEAGGITQHIGAYEVTLEDDKKITFLDTPGHEAFTAMRARGAKVTDIAIIVIAADDSVMPQTVEAINHAMAAKVPIIFAINKIDKPNANPDKIREALANMNFLVEEWGGKYQCQEISAKKGINIDKLLEKVLLEAEMLDLKANPDHIPYGTVLESSLEKGRGYVAKLLVLNGTLKQGDMVLAGYSFGRVKAMYNERNQLVSTAGPASPILLLGLNGAPQAGDSFQVFQDEREAKDLANKRFQLQREQNIRTHKHITLDEIGRRIAIGDFKELNVIIKGDVDGSIEALSDSVMKLSSAEVQVNVIHMSVGQITESDVLLASASNAIIIGFQVRPSVAARKLAEQEQIDIRLYSIIFNAINELKSAIEGMLSPEIEEKIVCNLEVKEVFKISKVGTVAGCMCLDGKITRNTLVRIIRSGIVGYSGKLGSLKRFKDEVKEVYVGQECGLNIENFNDIKVGDIIEGYEQIEIKRTLA